MAGRARGEPGAGREAASGSPRSCGLGVVPAGPEEAERLGHKAEGAAVVYER